MIEVTGAQLRDGDYIYKGVTTPSRGWDRQDHTGSWNVTVRSYKGLLGHFGSSGNELFHAEYRFSGDRIYKVRLPRPSEPTNEFGPICP